MYTSRGASPAAAWPGLMLPDRVTHFSRIAWPSRLATFASFTADLQRTSRGVGFGGRVGQMGTRPASSVGVRTASPTGSPGGGALGGLASVRPIRGTARGTLITPASFG